MSSSDADERLESYGTDIDDRANAWPYLRDWVLVDADRVLLAGVISVGAFLLFLLLNEVGVIAFVNDDSITRLAGGMIAGTFSLVTLVVSINQLILSREFTAADERRSRLEGVMDFRRDVADAAAVRTSPASPTGMIELLVDTIEERIETLEASTGDRSDGAGEAVGQFCADVHESTARIRDTLDDQSVGTFDAIAASIAYEDARHRYAARRVRGQYAEELPAEAVEAIEAVIDDLRLFGIAQEHFKTTYLQRELTRFSQLTIVFGVPSVLSAIGIGLLYADATGPAIAVSALPVVVSALIAVVLSPLALLVSYILRTATVTRRTATIGPMLPRKDPDESVIEAVPDR